ncbi:MAG: YbhB/YbcL family Raf kinase inhibitor-like protein [Burkholderiaceae bacterium]
MQFWSDSFKDGGAIPAKFAFCKMDPRAHVVLSDNKNPHLGWRDVPPGTQSLVLICHDSDAPSQGDDVNQLEREVPSDLARIDFFHWTLVDLPPEMLAIAEGEFCDGVLARGKPGPEALRGARQGINDYTGWFAADQDMSGDYYGYDGPCPPWNDSIVHRYTFTLYALDLAHLPVEGSFTAQQALAAVAGHVLAQASISSSYTLSPKLAQQFGQAE